MREENELDRALEGKPPKKPPTKQGKVDSLLSSIEKKLTEGYTLDQIRDALFPELNYQGFRTMVRRARAKRDKRDALASGETPAGPGGSSPATPATSRRPATPAKPEGKPAKNKVDKKVSRDVSCNRSLSDEDIKYLTDVRGAILESQCNEMPPPESFEVFDIERVPEDVEFRKYLRSCRSWREAHFVLHVLRAGHFPSYGPGEIGKNFYDQNYQVADRKGD